MKSVRVVSTVVLGALLLAAAVVPAGASPGPTGRSFNSHRGGGALPLVDHQGKILPSEVTYAVWWGDPSLFPADAKAGIEQLLYGFGGSAYLAIAQQYMRGAAISSTFGGSIVDPTPPPKHTPSTTTLVNEVVKLVPNPDPNAIYLVYTTNFTSNGFCAWHNDGKTSSGVTIQVAYMPNPTGVSGCDPGDLFGANSYTEPTRSLADSTAHEFMESVTDPIPPSGWIDRNGQEIGDKCNFTYSATVKLANKSTWQLQEEWSNAQGRCAQG